MNREIPDPGARHEVIGWALTVGGPVAIAAAMFLYLRVAQPIAIEAALAIAGAAAAASVLAGFGVWIRGVVLSRSAKQRNQENA